MRCLDLSYIKSQNFRMCWAQKKLKTSRSFCGRRARWWGMILLTLPLSCAFACVQDGWARSVIPQSVSSVVDLSDAPRPESVLGGRRVLQPGRVSRPDLTVREARGPVYLKDRDSGAKTIIPADNAQDIPAESAVPVKDRAVEDDTRLEGQSCDPVDSLAATVDTVVDDASSRPEGFGFPVSASVSSVPEAEQPVDLAADTLTHDEEMQMITASGHVELVQGQRILRADEVSYNLATDQVEATGNVVLREANGDVHFADQVTLSDNMSRGFVRGLHSQLADGGRLWAAEGERKEAGRKIVMRDASYTPCNCEAAPKPGKKPKAPGWQIKAKEVIYDEEAHRISYRHARFEVMGVPVAYSPYLSHPDGSEKQKSGFLTPDLTFDSELGAMVTGRYYWALAPHRDATFGIMAGVRENPVALGQYRQRFADAAVTFDGSVTYAGWTDSIGGRDVRHDEEWRGHLFTNARWDIDEKWRAGAELEMASDDQYLEQYNFTGKDVLENDIYVERFSDRNYATGRFLSFQDLRIREEQTDQPSVLPEIYAAFMGDPNALFGGRWGLTVEGLNLYREGNQQDMSRGTATLDWEKRFVTGFGLVNTLTLLGRGDLYYVTDRDSVSSGTGGRGDSTETRWFTQAHMVTSYPLVKAFEGGQAVIEPLISATLAPDIDSSAVDIPNEDSQDVQLDAANLFEANRFPGQDRIEDRSRVTYGLRAGLHGHKGSRLEVFAGQSHRLDQDDNPFPDGSGLSRQESDLVGSVSAAYQDKAALDYRFQLDGVQLTSQRHELDAFATRGPFRLDTRYLFAKALEGTDIDESREQLMGALAVDVGSGWRLRGGALYDLGEDSGLRKAMIGADYTGCCVFLSVAAERSLTRDSSGDSGTEIMMRLGLKNIGSFQTSRGGDWQAGNYD